MALAELTVKLHGGTVYYFNAGSALGEAPNRVDMLRDAIDNDDLFRSPDVHGRLREFRGREVANYHLS